MSEKDTATLTQKLEDMLTTGVGGKVVQFFSSMSVNICASLINFLLQNSIMRKYLENTVLILIVFYLLNIDNPENGYHISPYLKINCIDNHNIYYNIM